MALLQAFFRNIINFVRILISYILQSIQSPTGCCVEQIVKYTKKWLTYT